MTCECEVPGCPRRRLGQHRTCLPHYRAAPDPKVVELAARCSAMLEARAAEGAAGAAATEAQALFYAEAGRHDPVKADSRDSRRR